MRPLVPDLLPILLGAPAPGLATPVHTEPEACSRALADASGTSAAPMPQILRIVSWNTMKYARPGAQELLKHLSAHADLVAIQESVRGPGNTPAQLGYRYFAEGYLAGSVQTGVEVRSRTPASVVCHFQFIEPWLRTAKAVLASRHRFADLDLLIVSLHAINFTLGVEDFRAQFAAVGTLLEAHAGPAVVIGDFNNWNAWRQQVLEAFATQHALEIARFDPDWRSRHLGRPVDGLLQRGFEFVSVTAVPTLTSDHNPILARLRKPASAAPGADSHAAGDAQEPAP